MRSILIAAALAVVIPQAFAEEVSHGVRLELSAGTCRYGRNTDGAWWKENYYADFSFDRVPCGMVGVSGTPWKLFGAPFGWRMAWVDLGRPRAETYVPVLDEEANSFPSGQDCNLPASVNGCVGHFMQEGGARGISAGLLVERTHGRTTLGMEAGLYRYESWWYVMGYIPAPWTCGSCTDGLSLEWNDARGWHTTTYIGLTLEHNGWMAQIRRYGAVYASRAEENPLLVGAIAGPLVQVTAGYQWKF